MESLFSLYFIELVIGLSYVFVGLKKGLFALVTKLFT